MKVLITGAAGFIGSNLLRYCGQRHPDWELLGFDDMSTGYEENISGLGVPFVRASVADADAIAAAADGADAIIHLGALGSVPRSIADPVASHVANLTGTLNVLQAARRSNAYVAYASSSSVYGANLKLPKSEFDWTRPLSPYAVTKLGAEAYVLAYQKTFDLPTLAFRFFNVYGPRQSAGHAYAAVIPRFLEAAYAGRELPVHGDGMQSRDFTYVDSVCAVLTSAVERRLVDPDPVNLAYGTNTSLLDLIEMLREKTGLPLRVVHGEPRVGDVRASQADGIRIRELFPDLAPVPLSEGLDSTVAWYKSQTVDA